MGEYIAGASCDSLSCVEEYRAGAVWESVELGLCGSWGLETLTFSVVAILKLGVIGGVSIWMLSPSYFAIYNIESKMCEILMTFEGFLLLFWTIPIKGNKRLTGYVD